jgi:peptidoglycan hydrolase-like protein with peptidoglycan-binding domain
MTTRRPRQTKIMKRISLLACTISLALTVPLRADDAIASAQQALKEQGFYYGEITGRKNADTIAAIRRYQIRNGLKITGELNTETQRSLRITRSVAPTTVPQPPSNEPSDFHEEGAGQSQIPSTQSRSGRNFSSPMYAPAPYHYRQEAEGIFAGTAYEMASPRVQQRVIADAQIFLARRGYYRDDIDGIYGPGTEFALRAFQSRARLPLNGRFDMPTLRALGLMPRQHYRRPFQSFPPRVPHPVYRGEWIPD